jgi:hypothetical protein
LISSILKIYYACDTIKSDLESLSEQKKEANQIKIGVYKNIFLIV